MRVAVPIVANKPAKALEQIELAQEFGADIAELRLDFGLKKLKQLVSDSPIQTIASCRPEWAHGVYKGSELERLNIYKEALDAGVDFIELQDEMAPRYLDHLLEASKKASVVVIRTRHFDEMPNINEIVEARRGMEADISKIAPVANDYEESIQILKALDRFDEWDGDSIMFARGKAGRITRFLAPAFGSYLTYAYLDSPLAPGQISLKDLNRVNDLIGKTKLDEKHLKALEEKIDRKLEG